MSRMPQVTAGELVRFLQSQGFAQVGIEVLDAKDVLRKGSPPTVVLDNVPAVQGEIS
jgi:hypothetical protein